MLLPLNIRDSFLLSMRLDVPSILRKQKGLKSGSPLSSNDVRDENDINLSNQPSVTDILDLNKSILNDHDEEKVSPDDNKGQRDKINRYSLDYYESLCKFFLLDIKEREQDGYSRAAQNRRKLRQRDNSNSYSTGRDAENLGKRRFKFIYFESYAIISYQHTNCTSKSRKM